MTTKAHSNDQERDIEQPGSSAIAPSREPVGTALIFRNAIPNSGDAPQENIERGEGKWANGCFFTDAETGQRTFVPDSNIIGVRVR